MQQPLVSCIMPTYNRRAFIPHAIRYFLRQDYTNKELIIIDDGTDQVADLVPDHDRIRYFYSKEKLSLGAKLNIACAHAKGSVIANWDDDDWYATRRLQYQVSEIEKGTDLCGINNLFYYDIRNRAAYLYKYPSDQPAWLIGSSLCYKKEVWNKNPYADINVGMDGLFVWSATFARVKALDDHSIAVHMIHDNNISQKKTDGHWWHGYSLEGLQKMMDADWQHYQNGDFYPANKITPAPVVNNTIQPCRDAPRKCNNIYACLVHENEDCIIDLVRNLHYHDPSSVILLYNGGENKSLINPTYPLEKFGAIVHPKALPVKHGYLHSFALNCMEFALENFSFDSLTIVDSDQLSIRPGYSDYLGSFFSNRPGIGMLSSKPVHLTLKNIAPDDHEVWPAVQALKEYGLWTPLLAQFPQGESKFVHWTFWPSTVFTQDAARDLIKLFKKNQLLQQIMRQTKIWATEEVILPTLVRLLGYEIALNPCSYEYVKYQRKFTLQEVDQAMSKDEVFWLHPIERRYDDPLRKYARQQFDHYTDRKINAAQVEKKDNGLFLAVSLVNKIKHIEGWLDDKEAELLIHIALLACRNASTPVTVVETGSYHGKSTVLFGSVVKQFSPGGKVWAVDPHDGKLGATDQGLLMYPSSYESFKQNIEHAELINIVEIIKSNSSNVEWQKPVSLLFIDGLHDYPNVARDFYRFSPWLVDGAFIAFHDYADYFPGAQAFVHELLGTGEYQKLYQVETMIVLEKYTPATVV